ncbi:DJ-1/PfpI family protein [Rhodoferax sp.]|uniref:DJ-1/PfpI family protein n=1 Tax=Rhodoferax sp. TaxID=50421 RepID=UPI0025D958EA|nr:DJ-1/PfpI family protein [Rhodoferax sp.]
MTHRVAILVFDDVEALDFAGPYEVFTTASRVHSRSHPNDPPLFATQCVARHADPVGARAGLCIIPDSTFAACTATDALIIPGGVVDAAMACEQTIAWIAATAATASTVASVCTGAFLLARSGVLTHGPVTTHWEDVDDLQRMFPALQVQTGKRWITQGHITTSAGISAGIDMCLHLVATLAGHELATRTARQMDYAWQAQP